METWILNYTVQIQIVTPCFGGGGDYDMPGTAKHTHSRERKRNQQEIFCIL